MKLFYLLQSILMFIFVVAKGIWESIWGRLLITIVCLVLGYGAVLGGMLFNKIPNKINPQGCTEYEDLVESVYNQMPLISNLLFYSDQVYNSKPNRLNASLEQHCNSNALTCYIVEKDFGIRALIVKDDYEDTVYVVFKGTNPTSLSDLKADISQALSGKSMYYDEAPEIVKDAMENNGNQYSNVIITGHSLGGGLASYSGIKLAYYGENVKVFTFNPAMLNQYNVVTNLGGYREFNAQNITNIINEGDVVSELKYVLSGTGLQGVSFVLPKGEWDGGRISTHKLVEVKRRLNLVTNKNKLCNSFSAFRYIL